MEWLKLVREANRRGVRQRCRILEGCMSRHRRRSSKKWGPVRDLILLILADPWAISNLSLVDQAYLRTISPKLTKYRAKIPGMIRRGWVYRLPDLQELKVDIMPQRILCRCGSITHRKPTTKSWTNPRRSHIWRYYSKRKWAKC